MIHNLKVELKSIQDGFIWEELNIKKVPVSFFSFIWSESQL